MIRTCAAFTMLGLLAASLLAVDEPMRGSERIPALIARLGNDDFAIREDAEKQLGELGPQAIPALREAAESENPEVARRAQRVLARIHRRTENDKLLAPKWVSIDAENLALDAILADLSKQSGYEVVLGNQSSDSLAARSLTVKTGRVPFWQAVLAVCDAADLKITSVGGFLASDAPTARNNSRPPKKATRTPSAPSHAVVLDVRGESPRRSVTVYGAVCIEAVEIPDAAAIPDATVAILQVWPEPGLNWQSANAIRLDHAIDELRQTRLGEPSGPALNAPQVMRGNNVVVVNQVNGGVVLVNPNARVPAPAASAQPFTPSSRQFLVKLKPASRPAKSLQELRGSLFGIVRVGPEPMIALADLAPGRAAEGVHPGGADLRVSLHPAVGGKWRASIELSYETTLVQPAESGGKLGNIIHGIRVTDATGNSYLTVPTTMSQTFRGSATRPAFRMECDLHPTKTQSGPPTAATFWATYGKAVEVPIQLTNVPIAGGTK